MLRIARGRLPLPSVAAWNFMILLAASCDGGGSQRHSFSNAFQRPGNLYHHLMQIFRKHVFAPTMIAVVEMCSTPAPDPEKVAICLYTIPVQSVHFPQPSWLVPAFLREHQPIRQKNTCRRPALGNAARPGLLTCENAGLGQALFLCPRTDVVWSCLERAAFLPGSHRNPAPRCQFRKGPKAPHHNPIMISVFCQHHTDNRGDPLNGDKSGVHGTNQEVLLPSGELVRQ